MGRPKKTPTSQDSVFELLVEGLSKQHGAGVIFDMANAGVFHIPKISYGSFAIDVAAGGGAPEGRIIEIFGPESSGKTTLTLNLIKEAQRHPKFIAEGRKPLFIDAEHALDLEYAQNGIGVDPDNLLIAQPASGEQALQILETAIRTGKISVAVVDSVSTLVPEAELKGEIGDSHVGLQARLMSQALRTLSPLCARTNTTLVFINQIRMKIGVMFGNPETTSGGNALKFYASQRIDIRRVGTVKDAKTGEATANKTKVKFVKNKVAPPYRMAEVDMRFGIGIDLYAETVDLAVEHDLILRSGAWYSWPDGERLAQGRDNAISALQAAPEAFERVREQLRQIIFTKTPPPESFDDSSAELPEEGF